MPVAKINHALAFPPWQWGVMVGAYVDDIDTVVEQRLIRIGSVAALALLIAGGCAVVISRSIARPIMQLGATMRALAGGASDIEIPYADWPHETGSMARAVAVFRDTSREAVTARDSLAQHESEARETLRQDCHHLAERFQAEVGHSLSQVADAATLLRGTATDMAETAGQANARAISVSAAADQASHGIQTVAAAAEQLTASIGEISRQVAQSAHITGKAVADARHTDTIVRALSAGAQKIGDVVSLISSIRRPDQWSRSTSRPSAQPPRKPVSLQHGCSALRATLPSRRISSQARCTTVWRISVRREALLF